MVSVSKTEVVKVFLHLLGLVIAALALALEIKRLNS
jgi:hypothetical protein